MRQVVGGRTVEAQAASILADGAVWDRNAGSSREPGRAITFRFAGVAVTGAMVRAILTAIRRLRAPPSCA